MLLGILAGIGLSTILRFLPKPLRFAVPAALALIGAFAPIPYEPYDFEAFKTPLLLIAAGSTALIIQTFISLKNQPAKCAAALSLVFVFTVGIWTFAEHINWMSYKFHPARNYLERADNQIARVECRFSPASRRCIAAASAYPEKAHEIYKRSCAAGHPGYCEKLTRIEIVEGRYLEAFERESLACRGEVPAPLSCYYSAYIMEHHMNDAYPEQEIFDTYESACGAPTFASGEACSALTSFTVKQFNPEDPAKTVQGVKTADEAISRYINNHDLYLLSDKLILNYSLMLHDYSGDPASIEKSRNFLSKFCFWKEETVLHASPAKSCNQLGLFYELSVPKGRIQPEVPPEKNTSEAVSLYRRSCDFELGACAYLGNMYRVGKGVEKDEQRAMELFSVSCESDDRGCLGMIDTVNSENSKFAHLRGQCENIYKEMLCFDADDGKPKKPRYALCSGFTMPEERPSADDFERCFGAFQTSFYDMPLN